MDIHSNFELIAYFFMGVLENNEIVAIDWNY